MRETAYNRLEASTEGLFTMAEPGMTRRLGPPRGRSAARYGRGQDNQDSQARLALLALTS